MKEEGKKRSSGRFSDAMTESERMMKQRKRAGGAVRLGRFGEAAV